MSHYFKVFGAEAWEELMGGDIGAEYTRVVVCSCGFARPIKASPPGVADEKVAFREGMKHKENPEGAEEDEYWSVVPEDRRGSYYFPGDDEK